MKTGRSKALPVAATVAAAALGTAVWLDAGKCDGFHDWVMHALCFFEDDTVWAERYSEAGFKKIVPGMTGEDVVRLVGRPLYESYEWWHEEATRSSGTRKFWEYAQSGNAGWVRRVYFEDDGRTVQGAVRYHWPD